MNELENRVYQFRTMSLPGQPLGMHMGTSYLVNDLWQRVQDLERQNELLRAVAIVAEKYDVQGKPFWEAYQAAIGGGALEDSDGGAVDSETADSFRQAWSEAQAGDVRPLDELWDGIDGGALEEGE